MWINLVITSRPWPAVVSCKWMNFNYSRQFSVYGRYPFRRLIVWQRHASFKDKGCLFLKRRRKSRADNGETPTRPSDRVWADRPAHAREPLVPVEPAVAPRAAPLPRELRVIANRVALAEWPRVMCPCFYLPVRIRIDS